MAMKYGEAIKNGFRIINKNWQLVMIQIAAMFASFAGFFVMVGIPLAIAFIIFGLDLTELSRIHDVLGTFQKPSEFISKYFGVVVLVLTSVLLYVITVLSLGIFVFGGSIGVIGRSIKEDGGEFSFNSFLAEGKRLFFPLVGFTAVIGLIFIVLFFILGLFGGAIAAIVSIAREQGATLALFLGIFFSLILLVVGLSLILATLAVTIYGFAALAMRDAGPVQSVQQAFRHLYHHTGAFYLYCLVFGGYAIISFLLLFMGYPLKFIPLVGPLFAVIFQFFMHIVQNYFGLAMLATVFLYYSSTAGGPHDNQRDSIVMESSPLISEDSSAVKDISDSQEPRQEDVLPGKEESG